MKTLKVLMLFAIIALATNVSLAEDLKNTENKEAVVSLSDYAGVWSLNGNYLVLNADGTWYEATRVGYTFVPLLGGRSGNFTEVSPGQISIDNILGGEVWTHYVSMNGVERLYIPSPLVIMYKII